MRKMEVTVEGQTYEVEIDHFFPCRSTLSVRVNGEAVNVLIPNLDQLAGGDAYLMVGDRPYELSFDPQLKWVKDLKGNYSIKIRELEGCRSRVGGIGSGEVKAPIPGQISHVLVTSGQAVESGQPLLVLEAMKMYNEIYAACPGTVKAIHVSPGEDVSRGDLLLEIV